MEFDNIRLDKTANEPLYRQLAENIKAAVRRGDLREGERLPPIRAWKESLGVSSVTATQAYEVLKEEGFTSGQVGRGTFVRLPPAAEAVQTVATLTALRETIGNYSPERPETGPVLPDYLRASRSVQVQRYLETALARYRANPSRPDDFLVMTSGSPAPELFAVRRWKSAMAHAGESFETGAGAFQLQYGSPLGDHETRVWLAEYLRRFGLHPGADEILLTTGSQQALDLLSRTFMGPGDTVLMESPTYISALEIFEGRGISWLPLPLDEAGLDLDSLERTLQRHKPRLLYTVPTSQSPTGLTLSLERRSRLLELARRYDFFILEDDTCNEFYYPAARSLPALASFDPQGRVIYLKSFSKLIFPALRFGAIVASGPILDKLAEAKGIFDRSTSLPLTRSVLKFASHPAFERELALAREVYAERQATLLAALAERLGPEGCLWTRCEGGFSLLLTLPPGIRADEFHAQAAGEGVAVLPAAVLYPVPSHAAENTLRVSFGDNTPASLREGVERLGRALRTLGQRSPRSASGPGFVAAV